MVALRLTTAVVLVLASWLAQRALEGHVMKAGPLPAVPLAKPLAELPLELGDWVGEENPTNDPRLLFGDAYVRRIYHHRQRRQSVSLWIVYSKEGEDRGHHPEVCMRVAGMAEDPTERGTIDVPGHRVPVQQYRFGMPGARQWVFYWYYTMPPPRGPEVTELQRLYQRLRRRPSSVTLEVFAPETSSDDGEYAREFVKLVDAAMQAHLGPTAVRGSQRLPVTVLGEEGK